MEYEIDKEIDARGSYCPGPLMELVKTVKEYDVGDVLDLLSSDDGSVKDIPKWVEKAGHELLEIREENDFRHFVVKIGEKKSRGRRRRRRRN